MKKLAKKLNMKNDVVYRCKTQAGVLLTCWVTFNGENILCRRLDDYYVIDRVTLSCLERKDFILVKE